MINKKEISDWIETHKESLKRNRNKILENHTEEWIKAKEDLLLDLSNYLTRLD